MRTVGCKLEGREGEEGGDLYYSGFDSYVV